MSRGRSCIDDFTIDFLTTAPNPIFPDSIANFMIMDRGLVAGERHGAARLAQGETYATLHANGTGAFKVVERSAGR